MADSKLELTARDEPEEETTCEALTSCRWMLAYIGCIFFTLIYALRVNLGLAMVCMVKPSNASIASQQSIPQECLATATNGSVSQELSGDIEWDKTMQGHVLGSFFYGYLVTQIPGGYLSGRYGGKRVMLVGMVIYGLVTIATPFAARFNNKDYVTSAWLVIALRVIAGLSTGVAFPAMQNLLGRWSPPYERSKLNVFCFSGTMVGNVLMLGLGGFFCEWESLDGGWPSMFYFGGGLCLLFCIVWAFFVYDSPAEHPRISQREKEYIMKSLEGVATVKNVYVPWLDIMKSPAMWAIIVSHFCNNFGNYTLLTKLPAFMKEVLHFNIKSNGLYSTLPYIAMFIVSNSAANIIDKLRASKKLSTTWARKIAMLLAFIIPAGALVGTGHVPCNKNYLGVVLLTIAVGFTGFNRSGYVTNPQDIAPKYAGEVYGISNTFATIPGMFAPSLVNAMTPEGTAVEWQKVFYVWASVYTTGALVFVIFARGETQPWAAEKSSEKMEALVIPAAVLAGTGHVPCDQNYLGVVLLTIAVGFTGFNRSGYMTNLQDIASKYAGEMFGISNAIATIPGMIAPSLVNALTPEGAAKEWRKVFYVWASIYVFGAIFFFIFARGETQPWAEEKPSKEIDSDFSLSPTRGEKFEMETSI